MVNVFTGRGLWACIRATIVEESIPPERKAPSGTSATIWRPTASRSSASSRSVASASVPIEWRGGPGLGGVGGPTSRAPGRAGAGGDRPPASIVRLVPGGSLPMPAVDRVRGRDVPQPHVEGQRLAVDLAREAGVGPQRLQLGAEDERTARPSVIERLLADPVAGQPQASARGGPRGRTRTCRRTARGRRSDAPALERGQHDLGVGLPAERGGPGRRAARDAGRREL